MKERGKKRPDSTPDSQRRTNERQREQGRSRTETAEVNEQLGGRRSAPPHEEKPITEMSMTELRALADERGVKHDLSMTIEELRGAVRNANKR